jgi:HAD superfamily hydrolase (TIGR01450 family)
MHGERLEFDTLLLDVDGVLFRDKKEIPGTSEALRRFVDQGIELVFVTNNVSQYKADVCRRIQWLLPGFNICLLDPLDVLEATVFQDTPTLRNRCFVIGSPTLCNRLKDLGCTLIDSDYAETASLVLVASSMSLDYQTLVKASRAVRNGALLFGTGRERVFLWKDKLWPSTGSILAAVESASSVEAIILGKPAPEIFHMAASKINGTKRILVVGDDVDVDICGAQAVGYRSVLVLSGITKQAKGDKWVCKPDLVVDDLRMLAQVLARNQEFVQK